MEVRRATEKKRGRARTTKYTSVLVQSSTCPGLKVLL